MPNPTVRDEARRLVEQLPDDATWEDLLYQIYVRQSIEAGLEDCRAGRLIPVEELRRAYPVWSPYDAFEAAATLEQALQADRIRP